MSLLLCVILAGFLYLLAWSAARWRRIARWQAALRRGDDGAFRQLEAHYRALLARPARPARVAQRRLVLASIHSHFGRDAEALAMLDEIDARLLTPADLATLSNNRAYHLAVLGRAAEALPLLDDAEALVAGDDTPWARSLAGCITGTRGIALLHLGRLEEAATLLRRALELGAQVVAAEGDPEGMFTCGERRLAAERWWWLAEIARRSGSPEDVRTCLRCAAGIPHGGRYAARARAGLAGSSSSTGA